MSDDGINKPPERPYNKREAMEADLLMQQETYEVLDEFVTEVLNLASLGLTKADETKVFDAFKKCATKLAAIQTPFVGDKYEKYPRGSLPIIIANGIQGKAQLVAKEQRPVSELIEYVKNAIAVEQEEIVNNIGRLESELGSSD